MSRLKSTYEDLQSHIRELQTPEIEVWKNQYADRDYTIHLNTSECTCICPKTGLPEPLSSPGSSLNSQRKQWRPKPSLLVAQLTGPEPG